jgi:hypothetical protein
MSYRLMVWQGLSEECYMKNHFEYFFGLGLKILGKEQLN